MKTKLKNLNSTLTYLLEAMYDAEKRIQSDLPALAKSASPTIRKVVTTYLESSTDKRTKLKRIFSYLLSGPYKRKSRVTKGALAELEEIAEVYGPAALRDLLVVNAISSLAQYKFSAYQSAGDIAARLDLDEVAELITEIINWEREATQSLKQAQVTALNALQKTKPS